jgi:hypothetical protein
MTEPKWTFFTGFPADRMADMRKSAELMVRKRKSEFPENRPQRLSSNKIQPIFTASVCCAVEDE